MKITIKTKRKYLYTQTYINVNEYELTLFFWFNSGLTAGDEARFACGEFSYRERHFDNVI